MANENPTSSPNTVRIVQEAVQDVLKSGSMRSAVIEHDGATLFVTKGRRLGTDGEAAAGPAEYPEVRTMLKDDADSWLR